MFYLPFVILALLFPCTLVHGGQAPLALDARAAVTTQATVDDVAAVTFSIEGRHLLERIEARHAAKKARMMRKDGNGKQAPASRAASTRSSMLAREQRVSPHQCQTAEFQLQTSEGQNHLKIPSQVILTGPFNSFAEVLQHQSTLNSSLGITPDMHVRYFSNAACRAYLEKSNPELVAFFDAETHGSFRGDLCRTAVLAKEGGFYIDLDMQIRVPLKKLVDDATTFMTARAAVPQAPHAEETEGCLNAIIATVPDNPVMHATLAHMLKWYQDTRPVALAQSGASQKGLLGPVALRRGLEEVLSTTCPEHQWADMYMQMKCGPQHHFRLYTELIVIDDRKPCEQWGPMLCPRDRTHSRFGGLKVGLFDRSFDGKIGDMGSIREPSCQDVASIEQRFVGWTRFDACETAGCGLSGGAPSLMQIPL